MVVKVTSTSLPLTQHELDDATCGTPGCQHDHNCELTLHGRCHPKTPTWATYFRERGVLIVTCSLCHKVVAEVAVAP